MRFNNRNAQELYYFLFWLYLGASIFCFLMTVILLIIYYLTGFSDSLNVGSLFLLMVFFLGAFYFRINALHYHRILIENENRGEGIQEDIQFSKTFKLNFMSKKQDKSTKNTKKKKRSAR
ncbi:glucan phosphoethanolaminetransferase (alkaline phosphatase superfamily) [Enterococcus sp. PF1-24]|uniref:hypothetical protein n=1 Tax=unclassified Enterococcus TaxID=2608891 RepID=UPI002473AE42|nr:MULTISPECIES: hypothetical protein [unclassified Enterococcus]MDH6365217.1 glucan phosphoethanolaminetransferase (alkaline phosphatase superfamily) [Enterococcus sp. PFB1-1]MDH6402318.1 glucan phosphoethanolaminetransferase (alkaline phosphatase superfamily) [Enterococcus sp. PF1-24]